MQTHATTTTRASNPRPKTETDDRRHDRARAARGSHVHAAQRSNQHRLLRHRSRHQRRAQGCASVLVRRHLEQRPSDHDQSGQRRHPGSDLTGRFSERRCCRQVRRRASGSVGATALASCWTSAGVPDQERPNHADHPVPRRHGVEPGHRSHAGRRLERRTRRPVRAFSTPNGFAVFEPVRPRVPMASCATHGHGYVPGSAGRRRARVCVLDEDTGCVASSNSGFCQDRSSSVYDSSAAGRRLSVVYQQEIGTLDSSQPGRYLTQLWNTNKFINPSVRTVADFDPQRKRGVGNDYSSATGVGPREKVFMLTGPAVVHGRARTSPRCRACTSSIWICLRAAARDTSACSPTTSRTWSTACPSSRRSRLTPSRSICRSRVRIQRRRRGTWTVKSACRSSRH